MRRASAARGTAGCAVRVPGTAHCWASLAARGKNPIFHHPNILGVIYVTQSALSTLGAKGMKSDSFGNLDIKVFGTLDEALAHVRALA